MNQPGINMHQNNCTSQVDTIIQDHFTEDMSTESIKFRDTAELTSDKFSRQYKQSKQV